MSARPFLFDLIKVSSAADDTFCTLFATEFAQNWGHSVSEHFDTETMSISLFTTAKLEHISNRHTHQMRLEDARVVPILQCITKAKSEIFAKSTRPGNVKIVNQINGVISNVTRAGNHWLPEHTQQVNTICQDILKTNRMIAGREWNDVRKHPCADRKLLPHPNFYIANFKRTKFDDVI